MRVNVIYCQGRTYPYGFRAASHQAFDFITEEGAQFASDIIETIDDASSYVEIQAVCRTHATIVTVEHTVRFSPKHGWSSRGYLEPGLVPCFRVATEDALRARFGHNVSIEWRL